jgi:hypothetical protein
MVITQYQSLPIFIVNIVPPYKNDERELHGLLSDLRKGAGCIILKAGDDVLGFSSLLHALRTLPAGDHRVLQTRITLMVVGNEAVLQMADDAAKYLPILAGAVAAPTLQKATLHARLHLSTTQARLPRRAAS